jgi:hypothetical protein
MTEMFPFKVLPQWSKDVKILEHRLQAVWWMGETFPEKQLQEMYCDMGCIAVHNVIKDHFLCEKSISSG